MSSQLVAGMLKAVGLRDRQKSWFESLQDSKGKTEKG